MRMIPCEFCKEWIDIASDHQPICPNLPAGVRSNKIVDAGVYAASRECGIIFGFHREHTCAIPVGEHVGFHECICGETEDRE